MAVAPALLMLAALPVNSNDVFVYLAEGRIAVIHGANPYAQSFELLVGAIKPLLDAGAAAGDIRSDVSADDVLGRDHEVELLDYGQPAESGPEVAQGRVGVRGDEQGLHGAIVCTLVATWGSSWLPLEDGIGRRRPETGQVRTEVTGGELRSRRPRGAAARARRRRSPASCNG